MVSIVRVLLDFLSELLVEQRALPRSSRAAASDALDQRQPRRNDRRAPGYTRRSVPALSLSHHHELCQGLSQGLSQGPQPLAGNLRIAIDDGRTKDLASVPSQ
jgi:hypothetical protein